MRVKKKNQKVEKKIGIKKFKNVEKKYWDKNENGGLKKSSVKKMWERNQFKMKISLISDFSLFPLFLINENQFEKCFFTF